MAPFFGLQIYISNLSKQNFNLKNNLFGIIHPYDTFAYYRNIKCNSSIIPSETESGLSITGQTE
jgi:hypothetical protein